MGGWIKKRDAMRASIEAYNSASMMSAAQPVHTAQTKTHESNHEPEKRLTNKRGALCVGEIDTRTCALFRHRTKLARRDVTSAHKLEKLTEEAMRIVVRTIHSNPSQ